jgi:endo-1,4-beta-xylanase
MDPSIRGGIGMHRRALLFLTGAMVILPSIFAQVLLASAYPSAGDNAGINPNLSMNQGGRLGSSETAYLGNLSDTLGALAQKNGLSITTFLSHWETYNPLYLKTLLRETNTITVGWDAWWARIHPERDRYEFAEVDNLVRLAQKYNKSLIWRGEFLWMTGYPSWLAHDPTPWQLNQVTDFNRTELLSILDDHIETVVGRYKGKINAWYVANEVIESPYFFKEPWTFNNYTTEMRHNFWYDVIGPDYLAYAFNKTHEVDPSAKLLLNEGLWWGDCPALARARCDFFYDLVVDLLDQGVPLHGVGLQYYTLEHTTEWYQGYDWNQRHEEVQRFVDLGLEVYISEVDVEVKPPLTEAKLQHQAELYQQTLDLALDHENVTSMTIFYLADKDTVGNRPPYMGIFDHNIEPRPAYYALKHRLQGNTTLYQHDFDDPKVNPPSEIVPDMDWGTRPLITTRYEILTSNFKGTGSWDIASGNLVSATLRPGNRFWVNITRLPAVDFEHACWNASDYFDVAISGDGFYYGPYEGDYSFYDCNHFIRGIWYPLTPEWLLKTIPEGSRLTWNDWIFNFEEHSEYSFSDPEPSFTDNETIIGFQVENENISLIVEWDKTTGVLVYYHYEGIEVPGQLPLDLEFIAIRTINGGMPVLLIIAVGVGAVAAIVAVMAIVKVKKGKAAKQRSPSVAPPTSSRRRTPMGSESDLMEEYASWER